MKKVLLLLLVLFINSSFVSAEMWDYYVDRYDKTKNELVTITCKSDGSYYYCPGEEKHPLASISLPKRNVIYDYTNKKYYTVLEKNGQTTVKEGQYWIK